MIYAIFLDCGALGSLGALLLMIFGFRDLGV